MNYLILINSPYQSKQVQEKLFEGGLSWSCGETHPMHMNAVALVVWDDGDISYTDDTNHTEAMLNNRACEVLTGKEFLANPELIETWEYPEPEATYNIRGKEVSESTIWNALQAYFN